jgi:hypothetical protein
MPMPPVAPAVAAIVAASPREKALATLRAITPGVIQRRSDQELRWQNESLLKGYEDVGTPTSCAVQSARRDQSRRA